MKKSKDHPEGVALRLLAFRDHSRHELRQKMIARGIPPTQVDETLNNLAGKGFLDDGRYARKMAAHLGEDRMLGPQRILQKLIQKGVSRKLIDEAIFKGEQTLPAIERGKKLLQKKLHNRTPAELSPAEWNKLSRYFYQRGFSWEHIQEIFHLVGGFTEE